MIATVEAFQPRRARQLVMRPTLGLLLFCLLCRPSMRRRHRSVFSSVRTRQKPTSIARCCARFSACACANGPTARRFMFLCCRTAMPPQTGSVASSWVLIRMSCGTPGIAWSLPEQGWRRPWSRPSRKCVSASAVLPARSATCSATIPLTVDPSCRGCYWRPSGGNGHG